MENTNEVKVALLPKVQRCQLELLYKCLESDPVDEKDLEKLVQQNPNILTEKYKEHGDKNILQVACSILAKNICKVENINVLSTLMNAQTLFYANAKENGNEAIHYACLTRKPEILTLLVSEILNNQANRINARTRDGETAMHLLLSKKNPIDSIDCIRILMKNGIDVNISDNDNVIPLLHALKKYKNYVHKGEGKSKELEVTKTIVSLLIDKGKSFLHSHKLNKKTPKDYIVDLGLDIPIDGSDPQQGEEAKIFGFLKENDEDGFLNCANVRKYAASTDGNVTLLQLACIKGFFKSVKCLLENKASVSLSTEKNDVPIVIAARTGRFDVFAVLLKCEENKKFHGKTVLELTKRLYKKKTKIVNHEKCLDMILLKKSIDVNYCDEDGITPLHCASKLRKTAVCLNLLQKGALLSVRDNDGNTPIKYLDYSTLKKHFDYCIYYSTLDHFHNPWTSREDREVGKIIKLDYTSILTKSSEDNAKNLNMDVLYNMSERSELANIFDHPLVTSFLDFKFLNIVKLHRINMYAYILYCVLLYLQIFLVYLNDTHVTIELCMYFFWLVLVTAFVSRTSFQVWSRGVSFVKNFDTIIELILFVVTLSILFHWPSTYIYKKQVAAVAIVLSAYELLIYMGQLPMFSTNVKMLKKVTYNFVKFMLWYCCLIMGFALSFYILFREDSRDGAKNEALLSNCTSSKELDFFGNFWFTIVKAMVMLTGELDAASMPLELYPIIGVLIFMMFIIMISIVVFNLLNGLAVDDIQEIRRDAIVLDNISRIEQLSIMESSLKKLSDINFKSSFVNKINGVLSEWLYSNEIFKDGEVEITVEGKLYRRKNEEGEAKDVNSNGDKVSDEVAITVEGKLHRNEEDEAKDVYLNGATLDKIRQLIDMEKVEDRYAWHMKNVRQEQLLEKYKQSVQILLDAKLKETSKQLKEILTALKNINAPEVVDGSKQGRNYRSRK